MRTDAFRHRDQFFLVFQKYKDKNRHKCIFFHIKPWSHTRTPSASANYNFPQHLKFSTQPGGRSNICISSITCCQRTQMTKRKVYNCFSSLCSWLYSPPPLYSCCFSSFATLPAQPIVKRQAKKLRPTSVKKNSLPELLSCNA